MVTLIVSIKMSYDFLMLKKVIKMYKNFQKILKHILTTPGLELSINNGGVPNKDKQGILGNR